MKSCFVVLIGILLLLANFKLVNAAITFSDSFSGGYDNSLWTIYPGHFPPISTTFGIAVDPTHASDYSSLVHDGTLPKDATIKVDMKVNALPASDMGIFVSNTAFDKWKNAYLFGVGYGATPDTILLRDSNIPGGTSASWSPSLSTHHIELNISGAGNSTITVKDNNTTLLTWNSSSLDFTVSKVILSLFGTNSEFANFQFCDNVGCVSPTPTPTPTPPVILIPGMFASWNRQAILENKTVSQSDWKINPIVREYDGIKETLKGMGFVENTSLFIYPYDWRKKLEDAATELDAYITAKIPGSTKVDIVGHSLGGMVGRIYGQKYGTSRVDKLITVGSPHKGTPQAYKAFAGGEIERENFLHWLGLKLIFILNRGGGKTDRQVVADWMPVTRDLVPIYTFLTRLSDGSSVDPTTMTYKNNTLLTYAAGFDTLFPLFQSIAGESAQTLQGFTVNNPSASDTSNNIYPDGRPAGETKAVGDSTVVSASAKADTDSKTLVLGHGELIYKRDGIKEVIGSLGYSVADSAITEGRATTISPSLLFLIKSPATMAVEYKGKTYTETDAMIFLENAESGTYTLKVTGTGKGKYTVVVGQIIANNDYWDTITGEITKDPPSSQTDYYTINYPSSTLSPTGSKLGTGGGSSESSGSSTGTTSTTTTTPPATTPSSKLIGWFTDILGISDEKVASASATPSGVPADEPSVRYQFPRPKNPFTLMWWLVGSGLFLLLFAWFLRRYGKLK